MFKHLECADDIEGIIREWERRHAPEDVRLQVFRYIDGRIRDGGVITDEVTEDPISHPDFEYGRGGLFENEPELVVVTDKSPFESVRPKCIPFLSYLGRFHVCGYYTKRRGNLV